MRNRLLYGWTIQRGLYLIIGLLMLIQSLSVADWLAFGIGAYVTAMGLFSFGCAAGNCLNRNCRLEISEKTDQPVPESKFEELRVK